MKKLTKKQLAELLRLNKEKQSTFGKGRARTQNTLVEMGLARLDEDGLICIITQAGRNEVAAYQKKAPPQRATFQITFTVETTIELSEDMLSAVLTDEWRSQFYRLATSYDVAEHIAYNLARNHAELKMLDGFADREKTDAVLIKEEWEITSSTRLLESTVKPNKTRN